MIHSTGFFKILHSPSSGLSKKLVLIIKYGPNVAEFQCWRDKPCICGIGMCVGHSARYKTVLPSRGIPSKNDL